MTREVPERNQFAYFMMVSVCLHVAVIGTPGFSFYSSAPPKYDDEVLLELLVEEPVRLPEVDVTSLSLKISRPEPASVYPGERSGDDAENVSVGVVKDTFREEEAKKERSVAPTEKEEENSAEQLKKEEYDNSTMLRYQDRVRQRIEKYRRYPDKARKRKMEGVVRVMFTVLADGRITYAGITGSSGYRTLDGEALATVKKASPLPPVPAELELEKVTMEVPIVFSLKNGIKSR